MNILPLRILAMDTATNACSAALLENGGLVAHRFQIMQRGQSEALMPMVRDVLAQAPGIQPNLIAVTVGPGAFTGIRIGLAAARGLGLAWNIPVAGIATTLALAASLTPQERAGKRLVVIIDSKREDLWVQQFDDQLTPLSPPQALMPDQIETLKGPDTLVIDESMYQIDAAQIARLAYELWPLNATLPPQPLYLRPADVTLPKS